MDIQLYYSQDLLEIYSVFYPSIDNIIVPVQSIYLTPLSLIQRILPWIDRCACFMIIVKLYTQFS